MADDPTEQPQNAAGVAAATALLNLAAAADALRRTLEALRSTFKASTAAPQPQQPATADPAGDPLGQGWGRGEYDEDSGLYEWYETPTA